MAPAHGKATRAGVHLVVERPPDLAPGTRYRPASPAAVASGRNSASGSLWGGWLLWYPAGRYGCLGRFLTLFPRYGTTFDDHDLGDGSLLKLRISVIGSIGDSMKPNAKLEPRPTSEARRETASGTLAAFGSKRELDRDVDVLDLAGRRRHGETIFAKP
jgi:hypothetical protein